MADFPPPPVDTIGMSIEPKVVVLLSIKEKYTNLVLRLGQHGFQDSGRFVGTLHPRPQCSFPVLQLKDVCHGEDLPNKGGSHAS
jgi:hypothetical protein